MPLINIDTLNQWVEKHLVIAETETALPEEDFTSVIPCGAYKNINPSLQASSDLNGQTYSQPIHFLIPTHYHLESYPDTVFTPGDHVASMLLNGEGELGSETNRPLLTIEHLRRQRNSPGARDSVDTSKLRSLEIDEWLKIEHIHSSIYATYFTFMQIYGSEFHNLEIVRLSSALARCNIVHQTDDKETEAQKITRYFMLLRALNHYDRHFAEKEGDVSEDALRFLFESYGFKFNAKAVASHKEIIKAYDRRLLLEQEQEQEALLTSIISSQDEGTIEGNKLKKIYDSYRSNQLTAKIEKLFERTYLTLLSRSLGVSPNSADDTASVNVRASLLAQEENETKTQVQSSLKTSNAPIEDQLTIDKERLISEEKKVQSRLFLTGASTGLFIGGCVLALDAITEAMSVSITAGHVAVGMKTGALVGGGLGGCFAGVGALPGLAFGLIIGGLVGLGVGIYYARKENHNRNNYYATALNQLTQQDGAPPEATPG